MPHAHAHEQMPVYQRSLTMIVGLERIARVIREDRWDLRNQLRRASASVALNIAEGGGEYAPKDKARFYRIARRSAVECAAILDVIERVAPIDLRFDEVRQDLREIAAQLTSLSNAVGQRHPEVLGPRRPVTPSL